MFWGGGGGGVCGAVANAAAAVATGHGRLRHRLPLPRAGPVRPLRPRRPGASGGRGRRLPVPLWRDVAGAALRHEDHPLHARARHPAGGAAGDLARLLPPCAEQPARGDARPAARRGEIRRLALDHRAVLPPLSIAARRTTARRRCWWCRPIARRTCRTSRPTCSARRRACDHRSAAPVHNMPDYRQLAFQQLAPHLYDMAKLGPADMDIVQCYENFTGGVLMSLVEHGLVEAERGQRIPGPGEPDRAERQDAAEHQRRQPGRMLHARAGAGDRGGAPDPRHRRSTR